MTSTAPNFLFCIGAQKAGTTWLYDYFSSHPEVHVPPVKEMHYFNVLYDPGQIGFLSDRREAALKQQTEAAKTKDVSSKGEPGDPFAEGLLQKLVEMHDSQEPDHAAYRRFLTNSAGRAGWVADITPDYCVLGATEFDKILKSFTGSKMLYIMRDPVSRLWSHLQMHMRDLNHKKPGSVSIDTLINDMLAGRQKHFMTRSNYAGTLFALSQLPKDRVKYMFYETLFNDQSMLELCNFLNVGFVSGSYGRRVRKGAGLSMTVEQRSILQWLMAPVYRAVWQKFRNAVPRDWDLSSMDATRPAFLDSSKIAPHVISKAG